MKTFLKILIGLLLAGGLFTFAFYRTPQERAFAQNLKLAQAGDAQAALQVARAYQSGMGVKANPEQALEWYQQAALRGSVQAQLNLFHFYTKGELVPADPQAALAYLQAAAQENNPDAQHKLGNMYMRGETLPQHEGQALFWYLQAVSNGSAEATAKIKALSTEKPALYQRVNHFVQTLQDAQQGNAQAQLEVAQAYLDRMDGRSKLFQLMIVLPEAICWDNPVLVPDNQELFTFASSCGSNSRNEISHIPSDIKTGIGS